MKKQLCIATLIAMASVAHSGVNINYQTADIDDSNMVQREGNGNHQAINDATSKSEWNGIGQRYSSNKTTMTQRNTRNSHLYINTATVRGKTGVYQSADIKKLQTRQQGGSNNRMAVNKLNIE